VGRRSQPEFHAGWLCGAPENIESYTLNPVTGDKEPNFKVRQCVAARVRPDSCGPEGKWWLLYERPEYYGSALKPSTSNADDLLKQLETL